MRNFVLAIMAFFLLPVMAQAQVKSQVTAADHAQIDARVETFFASWQTNNIREGYEAFMVSMVNEKEDYLVKLTDTTAQVVEFFQGPFSYEKVEENVVGSNIVYRKYVLLNDRAPYVVTITMMRTSKGWLGQAVHLRDLTQEDVQP